MFPRPNIVKRSKRETDGSGQEEDGSNYEHHLKALLGFVTPKYKFDDCEDNNYYDNIGFRLNKLFSEKNNKMLNS